MTESVIHVPAAMRQLPSGWRWDHLENVCTGVFDCPHSTPELSEVGPFIARSQDIRTGVFLPEEAAHVSDETYEERIARAVPQYGDLLFSREGTYFGIAAEVPRNSRVCLGQRMVLLRPDPTIMDHRFLRYWLNSPMMVRHMHGFRDGSVAERLNMPTIRELPILVGPVSAQRSIASLLEALDDKIELNRRMNVTLEAVAQAIFKSWFIDFEPVRVKAEGLDGPVGGLKTLFPSEFQPSLLGTIPKGWRVSALSEVALVVKGRSYSSDELQPSSVALVTLKSFQRGGGYRRDGLKAFTGAYRLEQVVKPGELIVAFTDVTQAAEVVGKPAIVRADPDFETLVASLDTAIVRPKNNDNVGTGFLYCLFRTPDFQAHAYAHTTGTTVLHLSKEALPSYNFVCPSPELAVLFENYFSTLFRRIELAEAESRTLAVLRETLLPKLLSGELKANIGKRAREGQR